MSILVRETAEHIEDQGGVGRHSLRMQPRLAEPLMLPPDHRDEGIDIGAPSRALGPCSATGPTRPQSNISLSSTLGSA